MGFMSQPKFNFMAASVPVSESQNIAGMFKAAKGVRGWRNRKMAITEAREALARFEMKRFKNIYESISISNPYRDMETIFNMMIQGRPIFKKKEEYLKDYWENAK